MNDPKRAEYVSCPKCGGNGNKDCKVCHGMKTVRKEFVVWGKARGMELAWMRSPAKELEEIANEGTPKEFNSDNIRRFYSVLALTYIEGDLVKWFGERRKYVESPEKPESPEEQLLKGLMRRIVASYGEGPFIVVRVIPNPLWSRSKYNLSHPQCLVIKDLNGDILPKGTLGEALGADWFIKL